MRSIPPTLSDAEKAILLYLYHHPRAKHSTHTLASSLEDVSITPDEVAAALKKMSILGTKSDEPSESDLRHARARKPVAVQKDIEALIVKGLVRGDREGTGGTITHSKIELTKKGEKRAIEVKDPLEFRGVDHNGEPIDWSAP